MTLVEFQNIIFLEEMSELPIMSLSGAIINSAILCFFIKSTKRYRLNGVDAIGLY
jgi:hypothetical protein